MSYKETGLRMSKRNFMQDNNKGPYQRNIFVAFILQAEIETTFELLSQLYDRTHDTRWTIPPLQRCCSTVIYQMGKYCGPVWAEPDHIWTID